MPRPKGVKNKKKSAQSMIDESGRIACQKCKKELTSKNFYNTNSQLLPKYPICKSCLQQEVKPGNIQTLYRVLKDMDIGFVKSLWDSSCEQYGDSAFQNYLRMINSLPQYRGTKWGNSKFSENNEGYNGDGLIHSPEWMGNYTQEDLDYLEDYLTSLRKDFKIVTKNHMDYAQKIAKASLAMDRAYEDMLNGGSDSKYKMMKEIFDSLSKSAQFAESGRGLNDISLGSFGVVFDKVEKRMFVPEHVPDDRDMYDKLLDQFANINKSL